MITSKVRVAPLKRVTLPRLELLAALLGARLLKFVMLALELPENTSYSCWTDSKIVEGWIKGESSRWKQFVRNRVIEIQSLTDPACWKHVSGKENPADLLTRGVHAGLLTQSSLWLHGPPWLMSPLPPLLNEVIDFDLDHEDFLSEKKQNYVPQSYPATELTLMEQGFEETIKNDEDIVLTSVSSCGSARILEYERFSDFNKIVRILSWVQRFVDNCKHKTASGKTLCKTLTSDELDKGRVSLLHSIQKEYFWEELQDVRDKGRVKRTSSIHKLSPMLGEQNLLRVHGRLEFVSHLLYDEKHPIILPKCHVSYLIVKAQHDLMKHAGVNTLISTLRNMYWIIAVRTLAKKICKQCLNCQRQDSRPCDQVTAPLPEDRVKKAPPFSIIGIDHAGPLFCSDMEGKKLYILLFTCAIVRAVHVELVNSLSLEDFLLALKRFSARRGWPSIIYSDNAKTFRGAQQLLNREMGHLRITWKFNAPLSPWWGGWWERLIRSIKSALRKSLGRSLVTRVQLETNLHEIEACINSRPLTYVEETGVPLSPSHFLIGRSSPFNSSNAEFSKEITDLGLREKCQSQSLDSFWELWKESYIRNLPPMTMKKPNNDVKLGTVVLVREEGKSRLKWPLAIVTKIFPGKDGMVRAVELKTSKGLITRAIQMLHKLEVFENEEPPEVLEQSIESEPISYGETKLQPTAITRSGRCVKAKEKLNL